MSVREILVTARDKLDRQVCESISCGYDQKAADYRDLIESAIKQIDHLELNLTLFRSTRTS